MHTSLNKKMKKRPPNYTKLPIQILDKPQIEERERSHAGPDWQPTQVYKKWVCTNNKVPTSSLIKN